MLRDLALVFLQTSPLTIVNSAPVNECMCACVCVSVSERDFPYAAILAREQHISGLKALGYVLV